MTDQNQHQRTDLPPRKCQRCGRLKPAGAFSHDKRWLRTVCKACRARAERTQYGSKTEGKANSMDAWFSGKWRIKKTEEA